MLSSCYLFFSKRYLPHSITGTENYETLNSGSNFNGESECEKKTEYPSACQLAAVFVKI